MDTVTCVCGTETHKKKDGSLWKHQTPDGAKCELRVPAEDNSVVDAADEVAAEILPEVESAEEAATTTEADEVPDVPEESGEADAEPVFRYEIRVNNEVCPVNDKSWHDANEALVRSKAEKSKYTVVGPTKLVREDTEGVMTTFVYEVPVKE
jgi:hypothetical protein